MQKQGSVLPWIIIGGTLGALGAWGGKMWAQSRRDEPMEKMAKQIGNFCQETNRKIGGMMS